MNVEWTETALRHIWAARTFIARDNPGAARAVSGRIIRQVEALTVFSPSIGRPGRVAGTRELVVTKTPYIVMYSVSGETVYVLAVLHQAQRWPETLP
jgi:plasmid stabilization system protein ParE